LLATHRHSNAENERAQLEHARGGVVRDEAVLEVAGHDPEALFRRVKEIQPSEDVNNQGELGQHFHAGFQAKLERA